MHSLPQCVGADPNLSPWLNFGNESTLDIAFCESGSSLTAAIYAALQAGGHQAKQPRCT